MISKNKIKIFITKKYNKRIETEAVEEIKNQTENFIAKIIEAASRKASLSGRKTIKKQDICS
jgi:histone H3/H4